MMLPINHCKYQKTLNKLNEMWAKMTPAPPPWPAAGVESLREPEHHTGENLQQVQNWVT